MHPESHNDILRVLNEATQSRYATIAELYGSVRRARVTIDQLHRVMVMPLKLTDVRSMGAGDEARENMRGRELMQALAARYRILRPADALPRVAAFLELFHDRGWTNAEGAEAMQQCEEQGWTRDDTLTQAGYDRFWP